MAHPQYNHMPEDCLLDLLKSKPQIQCRKPGATVIHANPTTVSSCFGVSRAAGTCPSMGIIITMMTIVPRLPAALMLKMVRKLCEDDMNDDGGSDDEDDADDAVDHNVADDVDDADAGAGATPVLLLLLLLSPPPPQTPAPAPQPLSHHPYDSSGPADHHRHTYTWCQ